MTKRRFFLGEPIWVDFFFENAGDTQVRFGIPRTRESGFRFAAEDAKGRKAHALDPYRRRGGRTVMHRVKPGGRFTTQILLNRYCTFTRVGTYSVSCELDMALYHWDEDTRRPEPGATKLPVRGTLVLEVEPASEQKLRAFLDALVPDLDGNNPPAMGRATEALKYVAAEIAVPHLEAALKSADDRIRLGAVNGLGTIGTAEAMAALARGLPTADATATIVAARWLGARKTREAFKPLSRLLSHEHGMVRIAAMRAMARIDYEAAVVEIKRSNKLRDEDSAVRDVAAELLEVDLPRARPPRR